MDWQVDLDSGPAKGGRWAECHARRNQVGPCADVCQAGRRTNLLGKPWPVIIDPKYEAVAIFADIQKDPGRASMCHSVIQRLLRDAVEGGVQSLRQLIDPAAGMIPHLTVDLSAEVPGRPVEMRLNSFRNSEHLKHARAEVLDDVAQVV